ncbi:MAG: hypothetical protein ACPGSB_07640, partial [Opitutales bacterium]
QVKIESAQGVYSLSQMKPPLGLWEYFADASRNYTTRINDGQPLTLHFEVELVQDEDTSPVDTESWGLKNDYFSAQIERTSTAGTHRLRSSLIMSQADIRSEDYLSNRDLIFQWIRRSTMGMK